MWFEKRSICKGFGSFPYHSPLDGEGTTGFIARIDRFPGLLAEVDCVFYYYQQLAHRPCSIPFRG